MKPIKRILVPTDFSSTANNALIYALHLAQEVEAQLLILHAYRIPSAAVTAAYPVGYYEAVSMDELKEEADEQMEQQKRDFLYAPPVSYTCLTQLGPAVDIIAQTARDNDIDLIVMGTQRADGAKTWLGSVTTDTVRNSHYPVLAVPVEARFERPGTLLLATSLSQLPPLSKLSILKTIAREFNSTIDVLCVHPDASEPTRDQLEEQAALDDYLLGIPHQFHFASSENVNEGIQQYLDQCQAELLVMIPQHHSFLDSLLRSSHTKQMVFHTRKPLLAIGG
jgi:nucleotide-binding universal stress UspA family protein